MPFDGSQTTTITNLDLGPAY